MDNCKFNLYLDTKSTLFYKSECNDSVKQKYKLEELLALLVFEEGKLLGKVEGYYDESQKEKIIGQIKKIISN